jgi:hypothetical protein
MIGHATDVHVPREADAISDLLSLSYENGRVRVWTNWGEINVAVTALDVALEISDEIVSIYRRRVRKPRWFGHVDTPWPPDREAEMLDLIRSREGPPLPLHVVSSIVRPPQ